MAAPFKLQYLIVISVCLHLKSSYGFPHHLANNGIQIITHGEPCYSSCQLPVTIQEPIEERVTESTSFSKPLYRPLNLNYQAISTASPTSYYQLQKEYPISIQIPQIMENKPVKIVTPDPYRGKFYKYGIQTSSVSTPPVPISTSYNFDVQVPPPPPTPLPEISTPKSIELLTDLTSKIDKILIPACETSINKFVKSDVTFC